MDEKELLNAIGTMLTERLKPIENKLEDVDKRLDTIEGRLDVIERRLDAMDKRFDVIEGRLDVIEGRLEAMDEHFAEIDAHLLRIDKHLGEIDEHLAIVDKSIARLNMEVKVVRLTLESETSVNIMRIGEGHLDLSRKLTETIHIANVIDTKMENMSLYINKHEREINEIKVRLAMGEKAV